MLKCHFRRKSKSKYVPSRSRPADERKGPRKGPRKGLWKGKFARADGSVRWQALLMRVEDEAGVKAWLAGAGKAARRRLEEMGGAWIFVPDVEGCLLAGRVWQVAMRLRCGLAVRPALPEGARGQTRCHITNADG